MTERPIDRLLTQYANDHRHPVNQRIHAVCVPVILWSCVALAWPIGSPGLVAGAAILVVLGYYLRLSQILAAVMAGVLLAMAALSHLLWREAGSVGTWIVAGAVFGVAWVFQFVGHAIEGKRPSFLTDLQYLLVGPLWVSAKALKAAGFPY